jgi:hypothetical protein
VTKHNQWAHRLMPFAAAGLAVLLTLPALWSGWRMDDYYHRAAFLHPPGLRRLAGIIPEGTAAGLFRFVDGHPRHVRAAMELGVFPWWTDPEMRATFFRPIAALTHELDYRLWPNSALPMHAHSLAWFGALVLVAAFFYQRLLGRSVAAGLAALLFAVDSAHGMPAGWLANRNMLVAALFGVLALLAYDRWRRDRWRPGMVATPLLLALSLFSAEAGLATAGYLLAHALFLDPAPRRSRVRALLPSLGVVVGWRVLAVAMGVGTRGMGLYADPGSDPIRFIAAVAERAPLLLLGQWTPVPAELGYGLTARTYSLFWALAVAGVAVLALCMRPLLRRDRLARYFAAGMLLSVLPMCAAFPDDRLLVFPGLGAMGLLAQFLSACVAPTSVSTRSVTRRMGVRAVTAALAVTHLVVAPLVLPFQAAGWRNFYAPMYAAVALDPPVAEQSLVIVNGPLAFLTCYLPIVRAVEGLPVPRHTRVLFPSLAAMQIQRPDARTLVLTPRGGYLARPVDTLFRDRSRPFRRGERVELSDVTIEVTKITADGRPASIACHFRVPLEDRSLRWLRWQGGRYRAFRPIPVGATMNLPLRLGPG